MPYFFSFHPWHPKWSSMEEYSVGNTEKGELMNNIIYIVGLVVVVIAVLSFFGLR